MNIAKDFSGNTLVSEVRSHCVASVSIAIRNPRNGKYRGKENEQYAAAYNNRGIAYRNLGQEERAIEDYDEAIRLDPEYALAYNNRGVAYQAIGKSIEAERDFARAKELGYGP